MNELTNTQATIIKAATDRQDGSIHPLPSHIKGGAAKKVINALRNNGLIDDKDRITEFGRQAVGQEATKTEPVKSEDEMPTACAEKETTVAEVSENEPAEVEAKVAGAESDKSAEVERRIARLQEIAVKYLHVNYLTEDPYDTRTSVSGFEDALIAAYEAGFHDASSRKSGSRENSKQAKVIEMLKRPEGATVAQIAEATNWQYHTIRGFISTIKKKLGVEINSNHTRVVGPNQQESPSSYTTYFVHTK